MLPHELHALARNSDGESIAEARQLVNVPGSSADARFVLAKGTLQNPQTVRLLWQARSGGTERTATASLDGRVLNIGPAGVVELPSLKHGSPQVLHAEVVFTDTLRAQATMLLGCCFHESTSSELTGVPLSWRRRQQPVIGQLQKVLRVGGQPIRTVAIERELAEIVVVREGSEWNLESLLDLYHQMHLRRRGDLSGADLRGLRLGDHLRVVFAEDAPDLAALTDLPVSQDVSEGGSLSILEVISNRFFPTQDFPQGSQRIADAVAMAGIVAAGSGRPRAVILIRSGRIEDSSSLTAHQAAEYLRALRVPLLVWRPLSSRDGDSDLEWPGETEIYSLPGFLAATKTLRRTLDQQLVAWVEGTYLLRQIEIAPGMRKIDFPQ